MIAEEEVNMKKTSDYVCPACSEDMDLQVIDTELTYDRILLKISCCRCGAIWGEHFSMKYSGYIYNNKFYGVDGNELF